nr:reverse transcriptase domain-containing protein [Tanacetum cinerariifolium]
MVRALLLDKKGQNQSFAPVKAVEESCVTCGGANSYRIYPATDGNIYRDNIQEYVSQASAVNYNQGNTGYRPQMMSNQIRPPGFPPMPNNQNVQRKNQNSFILNQNRGNNFNQGFVYQPSVFQQPAYQAPAYQAPTPQTQGVSKVDFLAYVKANDTVMKNMQTQGQNMQNQLTNLTNLITKFVNSNTASTSSSGTLPSNTIANPKSDLKAITTRSALIGNKEKLSEMARTPLNEHCSAVLLKKLPEKLGDPGKFLIPCDFPDFDADPRVPLILGRSFLKTGRALIDVFEGELTFRVGKEAITFNLDQTLRYSANYSDMTAKRIDVIDMACEEYSQEDLADDKLPVIIAKDLSVEEKTALITVLKSHKRAIAWKLSGIEGINLEFCTHKILMEEDFTPAVQHQRRVNPKIHEVIKQEVIKLLDAGLIYPISDSPWVCPVHYVPKKGGITVVENEDNELIPTRLVMGWRWGWRGDITQGILRIVAGEKAVQVCAGSVVRVENSNLEEHSLPVVTLADQRTMAELLRAPTEGSKNMGFPAWLFSWVMVVVGMERGYYPGDFEGCCWGKGCTGLGGKCCKEPVNSLSMGDEHLDTISATKSDEVIKSSVEDLVSIPSEFEGILDTMCDVHLVNNPTPLEAKDHFEIVINSNDDISSSDDDSLYNENIEYVEASSHDFELVSLEATEIVISEVKEIVDDNLREKLLNVHLLIANIEALKDNPTQSSELLTKSDLTHKEFSDELAQIISPPEYDRFYFWNLLDPGELISIFNSEIRENLSTTCVNLPIEDDHSPLLTYVVWIFLAYLTYPVIPPYLHSFENEDIMFDPGITINHVYSFKPGLSHRCGAFKKFNTHRSHLNEWPMTINGKNTPILDVLLFHFYPP